MKLCFLTVMPSPYMEEFFAGMDADPELEIEVLYQEMTAPDTHWGEKSLPDYARVLPGKWFPFLGGRLHWNPSGTNALQGSDADWYIVQGYAGLTSQKAMRWLTNNQKNWIFWGERPGMNRRRGFAKWLRSRALKPLKLGPKGIAGIGSQAVAAYRDLTSPTTRLANIPYHCDLTTFQESIDQTNRIDRSQFFRILYCGQLIERKGLRTLFEAVKELHPEFPHLRLQLVGTGPLEADLKKSLAPEMLEVVEFTGFQSPAQLPQYFASADLFVLPSLHDGWGVVVNQALAAGLPLICSDQVGAGFDLITEGKNGFQFRATDAEQLAGRIREIVSDPQRLSEMSNCSRRLAENWTIAAGVQRWKTFLADLNDVVCEESKQSNKLREPQPTS